MWNSPTRVRVHPSREARAGIISLSGVGVHEVGRRVSPRPTQCFQVAASRCSASSLAILHRAGRLVLHAPSIA